MEAGFELTLEDFAQALTAHHTRQRQRGETARSRWWIVGLAPVVLLTVFGFVIASMWGEFRNRNYEIDQIDGSIAGAAPWVVLLLINLAQFGLSWWGRRVTIVVFLVIAVIGLALLFISSWLTTESWGWLWMAWVLVGSYWASAWRAYVEQTGFKWYWDHEHRLQGSKQFQWDDLGFSISDSDSRLSHRWHALRGWQETTDLFLLYVSDIAFEIVPKRAFATPGDLSDFRKALTDSTEVRKAAFPVIPLDSGDGAGNRTGG